MNKNKWIIFDLDGTIADIDVRRKFCTKDNGKMDWDLFFDPRNIALDTPNTPVIETLKVFAKTGHKIAIFSGRSESTKDATIDWLNVHGVKFDMLKMRPTNHPFKFMPDEKLKSDWFGEIFANDIDDAEVMCVFDDRQKVVDMWRANGISCFQVAPGNF